MATAHLRLVARTNRQPRAGRIGDEQRAGLPGLSATRGNLRIGWPLTGPANGSHATDEAASSWSSKNLSTSPARQPTASANTDSPSERPMHNPHAGARRSVIPALAAGISRIRARTSVRYTASLLRRSAAMTEVRSDASVSCRGSSDTLSSSPLRRPLKTLPFSPLCGGAAESLPRA